MGPHDLFDHARSETDVLDHALVEVDAALELVHRGAAVRIQLVGLPNPERIAGIAVARGQALGIHVALDRSGTTPTLILGRRS